MNRKLEAALMASPFLIPLGLILAAPVMREPNRPRTAQDDTYIGHDCVQADGSNEMFVITHDDADTLIQHCRSVTVESAQ